jgi:tRNA-Thr(GGU) m(6)t(6)A37 methyltransferase TsaA
MENFNVKTIGRIKSDSNEMFVEIKREFIPALQGLDGFSHINVIWWFNEFDNEKMRSILEGKQPYKNSPEVMGIFATRSPMRPNPIALTTVQVISIDHKKGIIQITEIDANDSSPVIDIKPYTPSMDRVENPNVPEWCKHWPRSLEKSDDFDWSKVFNF